MDNSTAIQRLEQRYKKVSRSKVGIDELVQDSNTLSTEIDNEILSVQDNEFIKNKKERLNKLGKSKDEVSTILKKLKNDIKDLIRSRETKSFSFNKTYSAKEVLGKLDPELIEEIDSDKSEESKDPEINKSKKQTASKKESNNKKIRDADKASEKSRVKIDVDASDPNYEPIKVSVTEDESSVNKIAENNEKIYHALLSMGEVDMANHVHMMMERVKVGPKYKYVSEITANTQELKSVTDTNSKIEKYLGEIRDSLRIKQDTGIERPESIIEELREREALDDESNPVEEGELPGFVETLLSMLFGKALMGIFKAGRGLLFIAKSILRPVLGWLLLKLTSGISALFNTLMKGPLALFNSLRDKVYNFISNTFEKFKNSVSAIKTSVSKLGTDIVSKFKEARDFAKTYVNDKIAKVTETFNKFKAGIKNTLKKIPGVGKLLDWMKDDPKLSASKQTPSNSKGFLGNAIDSVKKGAATAVDGVKSAGKYVGGKAVAGGKAVYAAGKGAVDWTKGKLADIRKSISEIAAKVGAKFSGIPKKLTDHVNKTGGIPPKTGIMSKLDRFTKVLRPIPFLGQAIAVGFAAKAAHDGWNDAGQLYGVPQDQVSVPGKTASAVGGLVKDLLWPLPISQATVASIALSLTGQSPIKGGKALKGDYDENTTLGDIDQFQQPPNDDFQPGGFSDDELLTASFKNVSSMLPDSMNQGGAGTDARPDRPSISPGSRNTKRAPTGFGNFSADTHPVQISEFKTEELGNLVGSVSAKYESGRQGVHTVSSGRGDPGGVSYGTYQLASNTGTMQTFLNSSDGKKYREMFSGTTPGSAAFNNIYAQIANKDPVGFNAAQHNFIKRTHYDPVAKIAAGMGVKVSDRAVQEALWSQSVQHGRKGNTKIIQGALDKADPNDVPAFLRALYNSRSNYISGLSIPSDTKSSINSRYSNELNDVLAISGSGGSDTIVDTMDTPVKAVPVDVPVTKTDDTGSGTPTVTKAPTVSAPTPTATVSAPTPSGARYEPIDPNAPRFDPNAPSATGVHTSTNMATGEVTERPMTNGESLESYKNQVRVRYVTLNDAIKNGKSVPEISRREGNLRDSISSLKMYLRQNNIDPKTIPEAREYRRKNLEELSKFSATPAPETPEKKVPEVPVVPEYDNSDIPIIPEKKVPEVLETPKKATSSMSIGSTNQNMAFLDLELTEEEMAENVKKAGEKKRKEAEDRANAPLSDELKGDKTLEELRDSVRYKMKIVVDDYARNEDFYIISRKEDFLSGAIADLRRYMKSNNIDYTLVPESQEYRRENRKAISDSYSSTPKSAESVTPETPEKKVPEVPGTDNQELDAYRTQVRVRYRTLNETIKNGKSVLKISQMENLLRDSISSLNRYLRNNNIDSNSISEAREYRRENLEELSKFPVTPEKKVPEVEYDNSDIPVVPEYLANPKPYSKPASLDLSASDLMKVESKTPIMMQGVQDAKPAKLKKPEDNQEHDPQQDVEEDEAVAAEYDQPTKGNGTDLKALQAKYVSLYSPWNPDFDGLRTETKERFLGMAKEFYETTGNKIQVNSAFRSMKKQQELYDNRHNNSNPVAAPGGSIHNYGMALDIQSDHVRALKSSGLLAKYGFGTPVKNDPPHIEDITVDRAEIRKTPYDPANEPGFSGISSGSDSSSSPSFGDAYDGEASDYDDATQSASELLESLGIDTGNLLSSFQGAYASATTAGGQAKSKAKASGALGNLGNLDNNIDNPLNNKTKSQQEMETIILETQEIAAEENNSVYSYIDKVTSSLQQSINNNTVINNSTSEPTSEIFTINNEEYYPDQELRY